MPHAASRWRMADQVRFSDLDTNNHVNIPVLFRMVRTLPHPVHAVVVERGLIDSPGRRAL